MTHCLTGLPRTVIAPVIVCPKSKKPLTVICVECVIRVWWWCNYRWMVRLRGCIARRQWHLTLSSSFVTYYVSRLNTLVSVMQILFGAFVLLLLLCTRMVWILYWDRLFLYQSSTAELACSGCTENGLYQSGPPLYPEVVVPVWSYPSDLILTAQLVTVCIDGNCCKVRCHETPHRPHRPHRPPK